MLNKKNYKTLQKIYQWFTDPLRIEYDNGLSDGFVYFSDRQMKWICLDVLSNSISKNKSKIGTIQK